MCYTKYLAVVWGGTKKEILIFTHYIINYISIYVLTYDVYDVIYLKSELKLTYYADLFHISNESV